jgi:predicted nucleic acid-binding protein
MKIFLDANVLVAVLNREYPLFTYAARIVSLVDHPRFEVFTSPICLAIAFYFAEKKSGTELAKNKISILSKKLKITRIDSKTVDLVSENPAIYDFEDGLEYYSAINSGCEIIITEDVSDFYFSEMQVYKCISFLENLK